MNKLRQWYKRLSENPRYAGLLQFAKFGLVGLSNTLVDNGVYYLIILLNPKLYLVGKTMGFLTSVLNAYHWNSRFVFHTHGEDRWKDRLLRLGRTYLSYGGTFLLSLLLLWVEIEKLGVSEFVAPIINLLLVPINFLVNKFWAFRK